MTTLNTSLTAAGILLSAIEDGPVLYKIEYLSGHEKPWLLSDELAEKAWSFRAREGAEFYALHLEAERAAT